MLAAALVLALWLAPTGRATAGDGEVSILVTGDSYSAGNGGGSYDIRHDHNCWRSAHNYGREFARIVEAAPYRQNASVRTVACSGDTTSAFANPAHGRPPQLAAVDPRYDLVFLTIGGNDLRFASIVAKCFIRATRSGDGCRSRLADAEHKLIDGTLSGRLAKVLAGIQSRADPAATIVLLGYPYLEGDPDYSLRSSLGTLQVGRRLRTFEDNGDKVAQSVVDAANGPGLHRVVFVRTKKLFEGPPNHELFAGRVHRTPDRWLVHPLDTLKTTFWYHPNATGWKQEARLLAADERVPKRDP